MIKYWTFQNDWLTWCAPKRLMTSVELELMNFKNSIWILRDRLVGWQNRKSIMLFSKEMSTDWMAGKKKNTENILNCNWIFFSLSLSLSLLVLFCCLLGLLSVPKLAYCFIECIPFGKENSIAWQGLHIPAPPPPLNIWRLIEFGILIIHYRIHLGK